MAAFALCGQEKRAAGENRRKRRELEALDAIVAYCDKADIFFLMRMDWKADVETLAWRVETALGRAQRKRCAKPDTRIAR